MKWSHTKKGPRERVDHTYRTGCVESITIKTKRFCPSSLYTFPHMIITRFAIINFPRRSYFLNFFSTFSNLLISLAGHFFALKSLHFFLRSPKLSRIKLFLLPLNNHHSIYPNRIQYSLATSSYQLRETKLAWNSESTRPPFSAATSSVSNRAIWLLFSL